MRAADRRWARPSGGRCRGNGHFAWARGTGSSRARGFPSWPGRRRGSARRPRGWRAEAEREICPRSRLLMARPYFLRSGTGLRCSRRRLSGKRFQDDDLGVQLADLDDGGHHALGRGSVVDDVASELAQRVGEAALGPAEHGGLAAAAQLVDFLLGAVDVDGGGRVGPGLEGGAADAVQQRVAALDERFVARFARGQQAARGFARGGRGAAEERKGLRRDVARGLGHVLAEARNDGVLAAADAAAGDVAEDGRADLDAVAGQQRMRADELRAVQIRPVAAVRVGDDVAPGRGGVFDHRVVARRGHVGHGDVVLGQSPHDGAVSEGEQVAEIIAGLLDQPALGLGPRGGLGSHGGEDAGFVVELARGLDAAEAALGHEDGRAFLGVDGAHADEDFADGRSGLVDGGALRLEGDADLVQGGEAVLEEEAAEAGDVGVVGAGALEFEEAADLAGGQEAAAPGEFAERGAPFGSLFFEEKAELIRAKRSMAHRQDSKEVQRRVRHLPDLSLSVYVSATQKCKHFQIIDGGRTDIPLFLTGYFREAGADGSDLRPALLTTTTRYSCGWVSSTGSRWLPSVMPGRSV